MVDCVAVILRWIAVDCVAVDCQGDGVTVVYGVKNCAAVVLQWIEADFRTEKVREEIGDEVYFLHGTEHQDH